MDTISDTSASGQSHDTSHGETFQSFTQGGMPKQGLVDPETARAYQVTNFNLWFDLTKY
jgi:hypothetical protein